MSGVLLGLAMVGIMWISLWMFFDPSKPQKYWSPFQMRSPETRESDSRKWQRRVAQGRKRKSRAAVRKNERA